MDSWYVAREKGFLEVTWLRVFTLFFFYVLTQQNKASRASSGIDACWKGWHCDSLKASEARSTQLLLMPSISQAANIKPPNPFLSLFL